MSVTFSPRLVGACRPDYYCLEAILASPRFAGKAGEALALAIYDHFASPIDGTYHFWSPSEVRGNPRIRRVVYDPVKQLNCYGFGLCGQTAHNLYGLYATGGLRPCLIGIPGHSLCEVYYEGGWHILDVDMWTWFRTPAGHIASAAELAAAPRALILDSADKSSPCNLPDRSLEEYAGMYEKTVAAGDRPTGVCPDWRIRAHTMDFRLRPGETLIRSQTHQGRFHMPREWVEQTGKTPREWHGLPRERYEPFRTFGNGRWVYEPDLTGDLSGAIWGDSDLMQTAGGLAGPGSATWRIASPYPFCGIPEVADGHVTCRDGVWLALAGTGRVRAEVADAEGRWAEVLSTQGTFDAKADITELLTSRYGCLFRVTLADGATLNALRFEGYLMTAPLSIPRLVEGDNPMELRCRDKHGLCTEPWAELIDFRAGADLPAQWVAAENAAVRPYPKVEGWQVIGPAGEGPVTVAFRFDAPLRPVSGQAAGQQFAWAYAHASLREGPPGQPRRAATLAWSPDGRAWHDLGAVDISNTACQWDCSIDGEAVFPAPLPAVWLRLTSGTPISGFEFHGHLAREADQEPILQITHRWREGEAEKSFLAPPGATRYVVTCGANPTGHTIEMHVPPD